MAPAVYDSSPADRAAAELYRLRPTHPCNLGGVPGIDGKTGKYRVPEYLGPDMPGGGRGMDPVHVFPPEVTLGILKHCPGPTLAHLEAVSKSWLSFLNTHSAQVWHAAAIAQEEERGEVGRPRRRGVSVKNNSLAGALWHRWSCEEDTWSGVATWKDFYKHQAMLASYMAKGVSESEHPPRQRLLGVPGATNISFWRMRPDYVLRLLICSAERGGLYVLDMDTSELLWSQPPERVGPYAHMESSSGLLALNTGAVSDNTIEIWQLKQLAALDSSEEPKEPVHRGEFKKLGHLSFDVRIQGWHLRGRTLCVVSPRGHAWIYDLTKGPKLLHKIKIAPGAIGHLDQDDAAVMYSMRDGYHIYDKATGNKLGEINPHALSAHMVSQKQQTSDEEHPHEHVPVRNVCTIPREEHWVGQTCLQLIPSATEDAVHEPQEVTSSAEEAVSDSEDNTPDSDSEDTNSESDISFDAEDALPDFDTRTRLEDDEWGVGMICGPFVLGLSKAGRLLVVSDWRKYLADASEARNVAAFIECEVKWLRDEFWTQGDEAMVHAVHFIEGGWMSLGLHEGNPRVAIEIRDHIYIIPLPEKGRLPDCSPSQRPVIAIRNGAPPERPEFWRGASFMHLGEDHLLTTYANPVFEESEPPRGGEPTLRLPHPNNSPNKCARFIHFAPWALAGDRKPDVLTETHPSSHEEVKLEALPATNFGPEMDPACAHQGAWGKLRINRRKQVLSGRLQWQRKMARLHNWGTLWTTMGGKSLSPLANLPAMQYIQTITDARLPSLDEGIIQSQADPSYTLGDEDVDQEAPASLKELLRLNRALDDARSVEESEQDAEGSTWQAVGDV